VKRLVLAGGAVALVAIAAVLFIVASPKSSATDYEVSLSAFSNITAVVTGEVTEISGGSDGFSVIEFVATTVHDQQTQDWNVGQLDAIAPMAPNDTVLLRVDREWDELPTGTVTLGVSQFFAAQSDGDVAGQVSLVIVSGDVFAETRVAQLVADAFTRAADLRPERDAADLLVELAHDGDQYLTALNSTTGTGVVQPDGLLATALEPLERS
jgi:hypothetical protein